MDTGIALADFEEMQIQLSHRRLHCIDNGGADWITVYTDDYAKSLRTINRVTTGKFMCGANFASFEDSRDAISFKLAI